LKSRYKLLQFFFSRGRDSPVRDDIRDDRGIIVCVDFTPPIMPLLIDAVAEHHMAVVAIIIAFGIRVMCPVIR